MLITMLSDTHGEIVKINEDADIVLHTGDFLCHSRPGFYNFKKEIAFVNRILAPWVEKILKNSEIFLTCGNHDACFEFDFNLLPSIIRERTLINRGVECKGIKIYGTPYQPFFRGWNFNRQDTPDSLGQIYSLIPEDTDILMTHCPPYGILDQNPQGEHCGSRMLAARLREISPILHCFGHIHTQGGRAIFGKAGYINCSVMDDNYVVVNEPIEIDYHISS